MRTVARPTYLTSHYLICLPCLTSRRLTSRCQLYHIHHPATFVHVNSVFLYLFICFLTTPTRTWFYLTTNTSYLYAHPTLPVPYSTLPASAQNSILTLPSVSNPCYYPRQLSPSALSGDSPGHFRPHWSDYLIQLASYCPDPLPSFGLSLLVLGSHLPRASHRSAHCSFTCPRIDYIYLSPNPSSRLFRHLLYIRGSLQPGKRYLHPKRKAV